MTSLDGFFESYRTTFARLERDPLLELFAFPLQIVSATEAGPVVASFDRQQWPGLLDTLLGAYRKLDVADAQVLELDVHEVSAAAASARVRWELQRADGSVVYRFTAIYTVVTLDGIRRIASVTHDELPQLQAALAG